MASTRLISTKRAAAAAAPAVAESKRQVQVTEFEGQLDAALHLYQAQSAYIKKMQQEKRYDQLGLNNYQKFIEDENTVSLVKFLFSTKKSDVKKLEKLLTNKKISEKISKLLCNLAVFLIGRWNREYVTLWDTIWCNEQDILDVKGVESIDKSKYVELLKRLSDDSAQAEKYFNFVEARKLNVSLAEKTRRDVFSEFVDCTELMQAAMDAQVDEINRLAEEYKDHENKKFTYRTCDIDIAEKLKRDFGIEYLITKEDKEKYDHIVNFLYLKPVFKLRPRDGKSESLNFGLYSSKAIRKGSVIMPYRGRIAKDRDCPERQYVYCPNLKGEEKLEKSEQTVIDAKNAGNLSRWINHGIKANCAFKDDKIVTKSSIKPGEQLIIDYGKDYVFHGRLVLSDKDNWRSPAEHYRLNRNQYFSKNGSELEFATQFQLNSDDKVYFPIAIDEFYKDPTQKLNFDRINASILVSDAKGEFKDDQRDLTVLMTACAGSRKELIENLIDKADPNYQCSEGKVALIYLLSNASLPDSERAELVREWFMMRPEVVRGLFLEDSSEEFHWLSCIELRENEKNYNELTIKELLRQFFRIFKVKNGKSLIEELFLLEPNEINEEIKEYLTKYMNQIDKFVCRIKPKAKNKAKVKLRNEVDADVDADVDVDVDVEAKAEAEAKVAPAMDVLDFSKMPAAAAAAGAGADAPVKLKSRNDKFKVSNQPLKEAGGLNVVAAQKRKTMKPNDANNDKKVSSIVIVIDSDDSDDEGHVSKKRKTLQGFVDAVKDKAALVAAECEAKVRAEFEARAKAEHEARVRAEHEARVRAEHEARVRAEHEARVRAEHEAKAEREARIRAEHEAKVAFEAKAKAERAASAAFEAKAKAEHEARAAYEARAKAEREVKATGLTIKLVDIQKAPAAAAGAGAGLYSVAQLISTAVERGSALGSTLLVKNYLLATSTPAPDPDPAPVPAAAPAPAPVPAAAAAAPTGTLQKTQTRRHFSLNKSTPLSIDKFKVFLQELLAKIETSSKGMSADNIGNYDFFDQLQEAKNKFDDFSYKIMKLITIAHALPRKKVTIPAAFLCEMDTMLIIKFTKELTKLETPLNAYIDTLISFKPYFQLIDSVLSKIYQRRSKEITQDNIKICDQVVANWNKFIISTYPNMKNQFTVTLQSLDQCLLSIKQRIPSLVQQSPQLDIHDSTRSPASGRRGI